MCMTSIECVARLDGPRRSGMFNFGIIQIVKGQSSGILLISG